MQDFQRSALLNQFRQLYNSEVQAARQLRRMELSLRQSAQEERKREVRRQLNSAESKDLHEQADWICSRRSTQVRRSLRANNLVRAFLRGTPYTLVESNLKSQTVSVERVLAENLAAPMFLKDQVLKWAMKAQEAEIIIEE